MDSLREPVEAVAGIDKFEFAMVAGGPPVGRPIEVKVIGRDFGVLQEVSEDIMAFLREQRGVSDIMDNFDPGKEEAHIRLDTLEAARLGLDVRSVAQTVAASFRGIESTVIREGKEEVSVRVRLSEPYRNQPETIERVRVRNYQGRLIPLSSVAAVEREQGLPTIYHHMGDRVVTVGADIDTRITSSVEVNRAILQQFGDLHIQRPGYRLLLTGEWEETAKLVRFIGVAFTIATLVIFSILVVQFNSLGQPFVVIISIPLGLIGVTLALIAHNQPISVMAMMGMVGLGGVAVNDAIVLVNFINQRRREGVEIHEAVHQASETRLRPILLTTVTTMTGLLPVIYGWGGYEPFIAPAAITLGYGLLFASFLTLFVVPSLYYVAHDVKRVLRIRKNT
jgi:multidrug efflux pump subunit AcrB